MATASEKEIETGIYELGYHLVATLGEEMVPASVSTLKRIVEDAGGIFIMEEYPVLTPLAYPINKLKSGKRESHSSAYFGWFKFEVASSELSTIKEALDHEESLLRYLLIRTVREDTRVPKRALGKPEGVRSTTSTRSQATEPRAEISEEALDRSLADLVVE